MDKPLVDPPTPCLGGIPGGLTEGKMVRIQGYVPPTGERFNVNFQAGPAVEPRDDVGLHLSVRLLEGYIARNTYQSGMWGEEQDKGDLLIEPGQKFEIIVLSDKSQYKVAVNGRHFCEFPQRFTASSITHVSIDGDVALSLISFENDLPAEGRAPLQGEAQAGYGPQSPATGGFGPPPSAPDAYGPPPGGYGPSGGYGPPGGYGPSPPGQYQPPPPPGYPQEKENELGSFLETAGTVLAGAIRSGAAEKLISSFSGGGANQQQPQQQHQQQYAPQPPPQQSQDSLGGLGTILSSFTQPQQQQHQQQSQGGDVLSGLGSLLSSFSGGQNPQQQQQQHPPPPPPQQQQAQGGGDILSGLGSLISTFTTPSNQQHQQPPPPQREQYQAQSNYGPPQNEGQQPAPQGGGADIIGGLSSLLSTLSTHSTQPQGPQTQPALNPTQMGGHGSIGGLGSMGPLLTSLAGQIITNPPKEDEKK